MLSFLFCMKLCYFSVSYINTILQEIYIQLSLDLEFNIMLKKIFGAPRPNKTMLKQNNMSDNLGPSQNQSQLNTEVNFF